MESLCSRESFIKTTKGVLKDEKIQVIIHHVAVYGLMGCDYSDPASTKNNLEAESASESNLSDIQKMTQLMEVNEQRLEHFARSLARTLEVPEVASFLKNQIGVKFDGDYNVLWNTVKGHSFSGQGSLRGIIAKNLKMWNGVLNSMDNIENVPRLQIALPVGFNEWDGNSPILVAYTPLTIDDTEWITINAYDAAGNEYPLDAQNPPNFPVMVVGINERTDDEGNVTYGSNTGLHNAGNPPLNKVCDIDCGSEGPGSGPPNPPPYEPIHYNGDMEIFEKLLLIDDKEGWGLGDLEIYFVFAGDLTGPQQFWIDLPGVNNLHQMYTVNEDLYEWSVFTQGFYLVVAVLERDLFGPWFTVSGAVAGQQTVISADWPDDMVGFATVQFGDFPQGYFNTNNVNFWMTY